TTPSSSGGPRGGPADDRPRVVSEAPGCDRAPGARHEPLHVGEVVEGEQAGAGQILVSREGGQGGARVAGTPLAGAAFDDRRVVVRIGGLGQIDAEAPLGV